MSYDGFYSELSTRASSNEILDDVIQARDATLAAEANVEVLAQQADSDADAANDSAAAAAASAAAAENAAASIPAPTFALDLANQVDPLKGATFVGMEGNTLREVIHRIYNDNSPSSTLGTALIKHMMNATGATALSQYALNAEEVSVAVFGVVGDGVTNDQAAMLAAINWANSQRVTFNPTIGGGGGSAIVKAPALTVPHNWTVLVTGNLPNPPILKAKGKATIQCANTTNDIFVGPDTYMTYMSDITLLHGKRQVVVQNPNANAGMWLYERVTFEGSNDHAIAFLNTSGGYPVTSSQPIMNECRWIRCKRGVHTQADHTWVCGGWMQPEGDFFDTNTAFIKAEGMFSINNVMTIPGGTFPVKSRWIDNYGAIRASQTRFGGEGGGLPIVYQFAAPVRYTVGDPKNIECGVSFHQCSLYGGAVARADSGILVLQGELPNVYRITDCTGPITGLYIRNDPANGGIANITTYLANLKIAWSGDNLYNEFGFHYSGDKTKQIGTPMWPAELDTYTYVNGRRYIPWRVKLQNTVAQANLTSGGTVRLTTPTVISDPYGLAGLTSGDTVVKVPAGAKWARVHGYTELNSHTANNLLYLLRIYNNNTPVVDGTTRYPHSATGIPGIHCYAEFEVAFANDIDIRVNQNSGGTLTSNVANITVTFD